jgi:hypothetical protein
MDFECIDNKIEWPETMKIYPDPKKLRETSLTQGLSLADQELQEAMVNSARLKVETNLMDMESKEMFDTTSYGQAWISDNLMFLADKIISRPTTEIVKAFIDFPDKLKHKGETVSMSAYLNDKHAYRAKGIKYVKPKEGERHSREQLKINEFVSGVAQAKNRAMTVSFIILTEMLSYVMHDSNKIKDKDDMESSRTITSVAGHVMRNVLQQLLIAKGKDLKTIMEIPSVSRVMDIDKFLSKKGKLTKKGTKLIQFLGIKSIKSLDEKSLLAEGHTLMLIVDEALPDVSVSNGRIEFEEECKDRLNDVRLRTLSGAAECRPVVERPYSNGRHTSYREHPLRGYLIEGADGPGEVSDFDRQAIDRIQGTAFGINKQLLDSVTQMVQQGLHIPKKLCLEIPQDLEPLPDFPAKEDYEGRAAYNNAKREWFESGMLLQDPRTKDKLDDDGKVVQKLVTENVLRYRKWKKASERRSKAQAKAHSINDMNLRTLEIAQWYADFGGAFYLPCYLDYRSRVYYCPTILNPQSSKLAKALFVAHRGKPIGEGMDHWLVNFTGTMTDVLCRSGEIMGSGDKTSWNDAVYIGQQSLSKGAEVASNPLGYMDLIGAQDDPFAYLAHCFECAGVLNEGRDYVSKIFISMDGSCNAYQHAAGYLKDRATGELVNLTWRSWDDVPADMYGTVAEYYKEQLDQELGIDPDLCTLFKFHEIVNRSSCKRITMCLGYGLTQGGAINYGKEEVEEFTDKFDQNVFDVIGRDKASEAFALGVWGSVAECAPAVIKVKEALAMMGALIAEHNSDGIVRWTTSTGTKVSFTKNVEISNRVTRVAGNRSVRFTMKEFTDKTAVKEVSNAMAPNFTHSRDADHIRRAVMAMPEGCAYLMIHDSFGTLAADAPEFGRVIRETFIEMYRYNEPLKEFFMDTMQPVGDLLKLDMQYLMCPARLEEEIQESKELVKGLKKDDPIRSKESKKRTVARKVLKILDYIEPTNDLDFDEIMECKYAFR